MALTLAQLTQQLTSSGLFSLTDLQAVLDTLPPDRKNDGEQVAKELVRQKKLTAFQAQQIYAGKGQSLVLGKYLLLDKIGQGGMGAVFKAQHRKMDRLVALKMLSPAVSKSPEVLSRFQREMVAAARLRHQNIVCADDADEARGVHFLVMEYIEGNDLGVLVKNQGPLPVNKAVACILQAAKGLDYAHQMGIVHRDIKPANLLISKDGIVKILDMGLARFRDHNPEQNQLTTTGQIMGTVDFMSPEQAMDSRSADARADIYSLGITLWFLLTGKMPYQGDSAIAKLIAHKSHPIPSLEESCPGAPTALAATFAKMVAKTPAARYQSMGEVIADLEMAMGSSPSLILQLPTPGNETLFNQFLAKEKGSSGLLLAPIQTSANPGSSVKLPGSSSGISKEPPPVSDTVSDPLTHPSVISPLSSRNALQTANTGSFFKNNQGLAIAGSIGGLILLLMILMALFGPGSTGQVRFETNDPQVVVTIKGTDIVFKQADQGKEIKVSPGEKTLIVEKGDIRFETEIWEIPKGQVVDLQVQLLPGKLQIKSGNQVIGETPVVVRWQGWPIDAPKPAIAPFSANQAKTYQETWARYLKVPVEFTNSIGMKFVLIPPGEYQMGSSTREMEDALRFYQSVATWPESIKSEAPKRKVALAQPFYLGIHEITQLEYQSIMGKNPSHYKSSRSLPVEGVDWFNSTEFCSKLSEIEKLQPCYSASQGLTSIQEGNGYRLPTEAQWEFGARAGTVTPYWSGDKESDLKPVGWFQGNSLGHIQAVAKTKSNPFGLFDVSGNVWEWVEDEWTATSPTPDANYNLRPVPLGPVNADSHRIHRGGSWNGRPEGCRSAVRFHNHPSYKDGEIGFRLSISLEGVKSYLEQKATELASSGSSAWKGWPKDAPAPLVVPANAARAKKSQEEWAKYLGVPVEYKNSIGMKLTLIPPGEFSMGSSQEEINKIIEEVPQAKSVAGNLNMEIPNHKVILTEPYYLGVYEVTQKEYQEIKGFNPSFFTPQGPGKDKVEKLDTSNHPVEKVSWYDAEDFCSKLNLKEKLKPHFIIPGVLHPPTKGNGYRLPTEAEWEFACRAGTATRYWTGDDRQPLWEAAWLPVNSDGRTHTVGEKKPNPFGLFDVHGNVWEWVRDGFNPNHFKQLADKVTIDPLGYFPPGQNRIFKGGHLNGPFTVARSSTRFLINAEYSAKDIGFRVALPIEGVRTALTSKPN